MTKILVVDDEELIRSLVEETLSFDSSFEILTAVDGQQALQLLAEEPAVVLLDIRLGGDLSGLEVCRRVCSQEAPPTVIFLSGLADSEDVAAGYAAGATSYLTKPFSPLELIRQIEEALSR